MYLKVEGRQPVRLYHAWTRPMRQAVKRPATYAGAASGSAARPAEAAAAKAPRLTPPVPGSKRSARKEKETAERAAALAKWSVPVSPLRYWSQTRTGRKEIYSAYVEAKLKFPFTKNCPPEVFKLLPKSKQDLMTSSGGRSEDPKKTRNAKVPAKASQTSSTRSSKPAKAAARISKPAKAAAGSSKPEKAETASKSAKAAENSSKPAKAASKSSAPVLTGSTKPTVASPEPQPSTSWADQAEHEDQDAAAGKAVSQHTPSL